MPDHYDYDWSGTAFSSDPGVHTDMTGQPFVTFREKMEARYQEWVARLKAEEEYIKAKYGPNVLDEWDELCYEHNERLRELREEMR